MEDIGVTSRDGIDAYEARKSNTLAVHRREEAEQSNEGGEQLLPGIPDEITIHLIAPKLPWETCHPLSLVSRPWQRAIQSHEIYDARLRSRTTQLFFSFCGFPTDLINVTSIALFSIEDGSYLRVQIPPHPDSSQQPIGSCKRVFLDGKLYVLGGGAYKACAKVYMLDLAGQRQWKQCASMTNARTGFGCGVKDGKIYTFGGWGDREPVHDSEVYDPKKDAWSPISRSVHYGGIWQKVTTVGDELFVHSGQRYTSRFPLESYAADAQVYHPQNDQWRIVERFHGNRRDNAMNRSITFTVKGKLHSLTRLGIQVFDIHASSWGPTQPFLFGESKPNHSIEIYPVAAVSVDDEVFALVELRTYIGEFEENIDRETVYIKSHGMGGEGKDILWQKFPCSFPFDYDPLSCLIEL